MSCKYFCIICFLTLVSFEVVAQDVIEENKVLDRLTYDSTSRTDYFSFDSCRVNSLEIHNGEIHHLAIIKKSIIDTIDILTSGDTIYLLRSENRRFYLEGTEDSTDLDRGTYVSIAGCIMENIKFYDMRMSGFSCIVRKWSCPGYLGFEDVSISGKFDLFNAPDTIEFSGVDLSKLSGEIDLTYLQEGKNTVYTYQILILIKLESAISSLG